MKAKATPSDSDLLLWTVILLACFGGALVELIAALLFI